MSIAIMATTKINAKINWTSVNPFCGFGVFEWEFAVVSRLCTRSRPRLATHRCGRSLEAVVAFVRVVQVDVQVIAELVQIRFE